MSDFILVSTVDVCSIRDQQILSSPLQMRYTIKMLSITNAPDRIQYILYITDSYICFDNNVPSSGGSSQRNTRSSNHVIRHQTLETQNKQFQQIINLMCSMSVHYIIQKHYSSANAQREFSHQL
jgi:hypothetical protein